MAKRSLFFALCTFINCALAFGQSSFIPTALDAPINSSEDECDPVLSHDGKVLFFSRSSSSRNDKARTTIWKSELRADGTWDSPELQATMNSGKHNRALSFSPDGQLYVMNDGSCFSYDLVTMEKTPVSVPPGKVYQILNNGSEALSVKGGRIIVYELTADGWKSAHSIKTSTKGNRNPWMASDRQSLFFSGRTKKNHDLYRIDRTKDGWSRPIALSDTINGRLNEVAFITTLSGAKAILTRSSDKGDFDLFSVKLFEDFPYLTVNGQLRNGISNRPLVREKIKIEVNPCNDSHVTFDTAMAKYSIVLPFGGNFSLEYQADNYDPYRVQISTEGMTEATVVEREVLLTPLPYVLVKGHLLLNDTDLSIPASVKARILVDNVEDTSAVIDPVRGTYQLKLRHGKSYGIRMRMNHAESQESKIDLSHSDTYDELGVDLRISLPNYMAVKGRVVDAVTGKVKGNVSLKLVGAKDAFVSYDSTSHVYYLWAKANGSYLVSVASPNYFPHFESLAFEDSGEPGTKEFLLTPLEVGRTVRMKTVTFETGKTILDASSYAELDRVAQLMLERPSMRIEISAHIHNSARISTLTRAREVADYLVARGVNKSRLEIRGYGATKPVAPHASPEGKILNTRVEYTILDK